MLTWDIFLLFSWLKSLLLTFQVFISFFLLFLSYRFSLITQSCLTLCDSMNRSTPGLPVHRQLPEFTQIHWCHPAISSSVVPFSSCPNPSQHQNLFQWINSSHEVAKVLVSALASFPPKKSQAWSPSEWTSWISLQSKGYLSFFFWLNIALYNRL